jgi:hypothetical protein
MAAARKTRWLMTGLVAAALAGLAIFVGASGCKSTPSRFETRFYDINTNLLPRVVWVTNVVEAGSGEQGAGGAGLKGGVHVTDRIVVPAGGQLLPLQSPVFETNVTMVTNYEEAYTYTPNERARSLSAVAGTAAGLLGPVGELVALLCAGAFGVWAQIRTTKATKVAGVLAQVIETGRAVLQSSPQGQKLDEKWKAWMITHQAEQGVIEDVVKLLATAVDDGTAKDAAGKLVALMGRS